MTAAPIGDWTLRYRGFPGDCEGPPPDCWWGPFPA
nr:MAG TPA: Protein of unknown function (DUF3288) [Caudoviricetes sp.]